jgi:uncharacterized protein (DUF1330 family)
VPKAYVIVDVTVTDAEAYKDYQRLSSIAAETYGATFLVRGGAHEVLEGDASPGRLVLLEFESAEAARAWYHSPEYAEARRARANAAHGTFILAEGASPS